MMLLSELEIGMSATVENMSALEVHFKNRLMDMGIYREASITLINTMAFGKMLIVEIDDVEICIRRSDAERIEII